MSPEQHRLSRRDFLRFASQVSLVLIAPRLVVEQRKEPEVKIFPEGRRRLVFVSGLASTVEGVGGGVVEGGLFDEFKIRARALGYRGQDFIQFSWGGWRIDPKSGLYYAGDQTCEDTVENVEARAKKLGTFIVEWLKLHPNDRLTIMTHSEAVQPTLFLMKKVRAGEFDIDPGKVDFIMTHATALGLSKFGLGLLAKLSPSVCRIGPFPSPQTFEDSAGENLLSAWDDRKTKGLEIAETVSWWRGRGSRIHGVGNHQDLAISLRYGWLPLPIWQTLFFLNLVPEIVQTQEVPGAENYILPLGLDREGLGHDRVWRTEEGLKILLRLVREQEVVPAQESQEAPSWRGVTPGRTTLAELSQLLGPPSSSEREEGITHLTYPRLGKAREDEIFVENDIVILVKEKVSDRFFVAYQNKYGNPEGEYWGPGKEAGFKTFVYARRGLAIVASLGDGAVLETWYFVPTSLEQFLVAWGKDLSVELHMPPRF